MQTLYTIHINAVRQISVDVFSKKHMGPGGWRVYFYPSESSLTRLRRIFSEHPKAFYINREWSAGRWRACKELTAARWGWGRQGGLYGSLDSLTTKGLL